MFYISSKYDITFELPLMSPEHYTNDLISAAVFSRKYYKQTLIDSHEPHFSDMPVDSALFSTNI